jgi:hypothetical protein
MSAYCHLRAARVALIAALVTVLPVTAQAQIGGLIHKAKQAVQKPDAADSSQAVQRDEFTEESITALLKGLQVGSARASDRDAFRTQQEAKQTRLSALLEQHNDDQTRFDDATSKVSDCQAAFLDKRGAERSDKEKVEAATLATDPTKRDKYMQIATTYSRQIQAAQAKGDTAAVTALVQKQGDEMMKLMGVDLHADTAAAVKACGAAPVKPTWLVEEESLREQIDQLGGQIRDAERRMEDDGARASGMTPEKYAAARERVLQWMNASDNGRTPSGFSVREQKLLSSHRAELNKVKNAL